VKHLKLAICLLALSLSGCAYRSIETASGTQYRSLHVLQRQDIAALGARAGDASFLLRGYAYMPDAETARAIVEATR